MEPPGIKFLCGRDNTFRNVRLSDNKSHGLWLDFDFKNTVIENLQSWDNLRFGLYLEASPGPFRITDSQFVGNEYGVYIANTKNGLLETSIVANNRNAQINLRNRENRPVTDRFTGEKQAINLGDWAWVNNVIVSNNPGVPLIKGPLREASYLSLNNSGNLWHSPGEEEAYHIGGLNYSFEQWQMLSGTDLDSRFAPSQMSGDIEAGFSFADDSPIHNRSDWPVVEVDNPGLSAVARGVVKRAEAARSQPYERVKGKSADRLEALNLSSIVNREARSEKGWIGIGITTLPEGELSAHGIPFALSSAGGVMLASGRFAEIDGSQLPEVIEVPASGKAEALYLLHVCGYASTASRAGTYTMVFTDGTEVAVDIDALGAEAHAVEDDIIGPLLEASEIQDWWPSNRQFTKDNARSIMLTGGDNPLGTARYLYSLEIANPHPEKSLKAIRFAGNPETDATLMVLSVSLLRP